MKRIILLLLAIVLIVSMTFAGFGCKNGTTTAEETKEETKEEAVEEEESAEEESPIRGGVVFVSSPGEPTSLDGTVDSSHNTKTVTQSINDHLLDTNTNYEYTPRLAISWEWIGDLELKMSLREGVKFHNGRELIADDVKESILRAKNEENSMRASALVAIESVEVLDDYSFVIHLNAKDAAILPSIAEIPIVPIEAFDELDTNPVGCGPFKFVSWDPGVKITVEAFDDYWQEGKPYVDGIQFILSLDDSGKMAGLQSGEINIVTNPSEADVVAIGSGNIEGVSTLTGENPFSGYFIALNMDKEPFKSNLKLRQAISYAIDREEISELCFNGEKPPQYSYVWETAVWYNPEWEEIITYNPEKAKQLLAEAGYPDGIDIDMIALSLSQYRSMAEVFQAQMEEVGININLEILEGASYSERLYTNKDFTIAISGVASANDPSLIPRKLYISGLWTMISDDSMDEWVAENYQTYDFEERYSIIDKMEKYRIENVLGIVFIIKPVETIAITDNIENFLGMWDGKYDYSDLTIIDNS